MANQSWGTLANAPSYSSENTGIVLENSTTETDISPGANKEGFAFTVGRDCPALESGQVLRYTARGTISFLTSAEIVIGLFWGGYASGVALAKTASIKCPTAATNQMWNLEATSRLVSVGESGKILTHGVIDGVEADSALATSSGSTMMPQESATGGEATINTTVNKTLTLGAKWTAASTSNKIQIYQWLVEILN